MSATWKGLVAALALACAPAALAQSTEIDKPDPAVEHRLKVLAEELRCLVCQNQTIADSNAPLALDLRNQIRTQVAQGRSDDQIREYMVQRYGDFVLYNPPLRATTVLLWAGPFVLLVGGIAFLVLRVRRAPGGATPRPEPSARRADIEALLEGDDSPGANGGQKKKGGPAGRP